MTSKLTSSLQQIGHSTQTAITTNCKAHMQNQATPSIHPMPASFQPVNPRWEISSAHQWDLLEKARWFKSDLHKITRQFNDPNDFDWSKVNDWLYDYIVLLGQACPQGLPSRRDPLLLWLGSRAARGHDDRASLTTKKKGLFKEVANGHSHLAWHWLECKPWELSMTQSTENTLQTQLSETAAESKTRKTLLKLALVEIILCWLAVIDMWHWQACFVLIEARNGWALSRLIQAHLQMYLWGLTTCPPNMISNHV